LWQRSGKKGRRRNENRADDEIAAAAELSVNGLKKPLKSLCAPGFVSAKVYMVRVFTTQVINYCSFSSAHRSLCLSCGELSFLRPLTLFQRQFILIESTDALMPHSLCLPTADW